MFARAVARAGRDTIFGLNYVITGNPFTFKNRDEFKSFLENRGAKLQSKISAKTDYLIMNDADTDTEKKR